MTNDLEGPEFVDEEDSSLDPNQVNRFSQAVLYSSDWTVETVISQLERGNIEMNPRFQRRDAWSSRGKSLFIESIILGLPIPQIVLAEKTGQRGRYIVLDGKQRLLTLLQFTGKAEADSHRNRFALSNLEARADLSRKRFRHLENMPELKDDLNAFMNHTLRTVVIRNWPSMEFLHLVFLRLNTGSVKLSPQELRQAMVPGEFSNFIDDAAASSPELRALLQRSSPDPRMRDVELLVRFLSMKNYINDYAGRMKSFLDESCERLNSEWPKRENQIKQQVEEFQAAIRLLITIFGTERIARKQGSRSFNRAIFDVLVFYASDTQIRELMENTKDAVVNAYNQILREDEFIESVESDTAGIPHTVGRLALWGAALSQALNQQIRTPVSVDGRVRFDGFW